MKTIDRRRYMNSMGDILSVTLEGGCLQNGTPTPDNPVDIICNNGTISWDSVNKQIVANGTQEVVSDAKGNHATAENLLGVKNYKDTQEVLSGDVTRNVGIKVLDGSESIAFAYSMIRIAIPIQVEKTSGWQSRRLCTHGICGSSKASNALWEIDNNYSWIGGGIKSDMGWSSADDVKAWLVEQYANGTPVIIVYPLATPTTESVEGQKLIQSPVTQIAGSIDNLPVNVITK